MRIGMRRNHVLLTSSFLGLAGLASAATGCTWTDFDDLADQTPVDRISDPNAVPSADYGRLITEANDEPGSGDLPGKKIEIRERHVQTFADHGKAKGIRTRVRMRA